MISLLPLLLLLVRLRVSHGFGIPGSSSTNSGYDTEGGEEPVCWVGHSDLGGMDTNTKVTPWDNKLFRGFVLTGELELLPECPGGVHVEGEAPVELRDGDEVMRTGRFYDYVVRGSINLDNMDGDAIFSDIGPSVAVQVILCELGKTGLCSPFVHEHANDRLIANNATVPLQTGDRHGDTHVHSPTVFKTLEPFFGGIQEFEMTVPVKVNHPGNFFAIGAFQVFTFTINGAGGAGGAALQHKLDVANALDVRLIAYQDPPEILTVTQAMQIFTAVLIAVSVGMLAFLLFVTLRERGNRVMQLSQFPFLVVFLIAAMMATACSFLFNPKSDTYCLIRTPCVILPLHIMYAIIIGRLWRINAVISPLLTMAIENEKKTYLSGKFFGFLTIIADLKCPGFPPNKVTFRSKGSIRASVTNIQLAKVVFVFTLPQIIMQVVSLTLQPSQMVIEYNTDESMGRQTCKSSDKASTSLESWSWYLLLLLFMVMLFLAYQCRTLPSLFNETESIYNATLISTIAMAVGFIVIRISDSPTTSPDVEYLFHVLIVVTMTLNAALRTMLPKVKLAWSGKPVLVSKLVTDHRMATQSRDSDAKESVRLVNSQRSRRSRSNNVTSDGAGSSGMLQHSTEVSENGHRFDPEVPLEPRVVPIHSNQESRQENYQDSAQFIDENVTKGASDDTSICMHDLNNKDEDLNELSSHSCPVTHPSPAHHLEPYRRSSDDMWRPSSSRRNVDSSYNKQQWELRRMHGSPSDRYLVAPSTSIRISDEHTPARRLLLRMVDAQNVLEKVNREVMSGFSVSHEEWDSVRSACVELGRVLRDDVKFDWEDREEEVEDEIQQQGGRAVAA